CVLLSIAFFYKLQKFIFMVVEWSGRHSTPAGSEERLETPQAQPSRGRLSFLPGAWSNCSAMERVSFNLYLQQSMRKQPTFFSYFLGRALRLHKCKK
ncbi:hypothetical protein CJ195_07490, partial [Bacillus sp. UMB0899]